MVRNSHSSDSGDYTLPKSDILRGRKQFKRLFEHKAQLIRNKHINLRFQVTGTSPDNTQMGFIVKKSLGKAFKRNRMKRLLKEAYRLHQFLLMNVLHELQLTIQGAFMAKRTEVDYNTVEENVVWLLERAATQLPSQDHDNL